MLRLRLLVGAPLMSSRMRSKSLSARVRPAAVSKRFEKARVASIILLGRSYIGNSESVL